MNRIPSIRLVLVATALTALLAVPTAHARGLESPSRVEAGWIGTAMKWLGDLTGLRLAPRTRTAINKEDTGGVTGGGGLTGGEYGTTGGSCVDPQGRPRPLCDL